MKEHVEHNHGERGNGFDQKLSILNAEKRKLKRTEIKPVKINKYK